MSRLLPNTTPAERRRGCTFAETFETQALVEENGGAAVGTPTFNFGVTLNGTTDYVTYDLCATEYDSANISIVVEFTPHFNWNDNNFRVIVDDNLNDYRIRKYNAAGNYVLLIMLGNTVIDYISSATYGPHWLVGQRNVLVISGTSGNTNVWLNGNQILTADPSAWTPTRPTTLFVGASNVGANLFDGIIHSVKIFKCRLTVGEASDFWGDGIRANIYDYKREATAFWQMRAEDHDPTNVRTLDSSGNLHHAVFGDGATPALYPAKIAARHGYDFDGTNDYMQVASTNVLNSLQISIVIEFSPDFISTENANRCLFNSLGDSYRVRKSDNAGANTLRVELGGTTVANIAQATYGSAWYAGGRNFLAVTSDSVTDITNVWLNGIRVLNAGAVAWTPANPATFCLGANSTGGANFFDGRIFAVSIYPSVLTPLQVADAWVKSQAAANQV